MLLNGFGGRKRGIAEFQLGDLQRRAFDTEFLHVAFTIGIRDYRVLERYLQSARGEHLLHSLSGILHGGAGFRQRPFEERKFSANGVGQFGIREPWNVVEVGGDARGFLNVVGDQDGAELRLEVKTYFGEKPASNELVGGSLQITPANLGARSQAGDSDDLGLGEDFLAVGVDFAQWRSGGVRSLRGNGEAGRYQKEQENAETRSKIAKHAPIVAETGRATP